MYDPGTIHATRTRRIECRRALVACATVSKLMSHHALNVLWEELDSLNPVLRLLPNGEKRTGNGPLHTVSGVL